MRSESFDYFQYMKPMISSIGYIQDKKNEYLKKALLPRSSRPCSKQMHYKERIPVEIRIQRAFEKASEFSQNNLSQKQILRKGSFAFLVKERSEFVKSSDSPPPIGRYTPNNEFLMKKSPEVIFGKAKLPWEIENERKIRAKSCDISVESTYIFENEKKKIKGIPFDKQISRKSLLNNSSYEKISLTRYSSKCLRPSDRINKIESIINKKVFKKRSENSPNLSFIKRQSKSFMIL
ncbi:unnamed protein product [Blepharisma stoltei]|uniref:Uncharacterized protein n=1 Tax=Blepharisma stoltei TaxID=1481888 RepID=A0AAU9K5L6_9CILI|nr:unnamed protein product [Blepharisma stoltei]